MLMLSFVASTIYEGSDESKSKTGSTDSQASSQFRSSTTSSSASGHSAAMATQSAAAATTNSWTPAASTVFPPSHASVMDEPAPAVCASDYFHLIQLTGRFSRITPD